MSTQNVQTFDLPKKFLLPQTLSTYNKTNKQEELFIFGAYKNDNIYCTCIKNNELI